MIALDVTRQRVVSGGWCVCHGASQRGNSGKGKVGKTGSSFGNFVFWDYGVLLELRRLYRPFVGSIAGLSDGDALCSPLALLLSLWSRQLGAHYGRLLSPIGPPLSV